MIYDEEIGKLINKEISRFYSIEEEFIKTKYCFDRKTKLLYFYNEYDNTRELNEFIESEHKSAYFWDSLKDKVNRIYLKRRIKKIK